MKTVIARFQELKKSPEEIGEVDGEIVDANKIEGALRSVGVALRDEEGQFRNLDDVFLELAKKWNTLDKNTQRYIATMAAGSRQQSRFIAMMQDYDHTMELVSAANNSAGASQRQYEKTLDSLKSKLAKLENAWHEFVLGLANSDVIKGFVDGLTNLINKINELTFSSNAAGNTLKKFGMAFAIFKGGKAITQKIVPNWIQSLLGLNGDNGLLDAGENYGRTFIEGIKNSLNKHNTEFSELFNNIAGAFDEGVEDLDLNTLRVSINDIDGSSRKLINAYDILNDSQKTFFNSASKEIIERWKNIAAISGEEKANRYLNDQLATQNALNSGGITKLLTRIGLLAKDTTNTIFNTTAEQANTKAKLSAIAAQMGLNSSMLLGIGIVAGITLLIFGLVKAYKEIQEKSPEGQIKKLDEEFDSLQETISNNSEAIKTLENNFDDLTAKYDGLKELTRGTLEWNNAISDINTSVLELIDKYPELMQFVTRGENGELILDVNSESVQNILKDYQNQNQALQSSSTGLRIQKLQIETDTKYDDLGFNSRLNSVNYRKDTEDLALALVDGTIINATKDSINKYLVEKGITNVNGAQTTFKGNEQNIEELKEFGKALQAVTAEELSYGEIIANNAFLLSNAERLQGNEYEASNKLLTSNYVTDLIKNQSVSSNDYQKYAEEAYGIGAIYDEAKNEITDLSGATHLVNEQMIKTWKGQKETTNIINRFNSSVNSLDSSFVALLSDRSGANLTSDDINRLNAGGIEQFWTNVDEDLQRVFESRKEELEEVVESAGGQNEVLNKYLKQFDFTVTDNLTNGLMTGLQEKLQSILELSGSGAAKAIGSTINSIASKLSADEQIAFINQINGLDWSNIQAINELETTLKDLGIAVEQTELDTLIAQIKNFSDAISNVTFEEIMESIKTLKGLQDDLNERSLTNNRVFSYDEMMSYIGLGANAKDFTAIGLDEFEYDGKLIDLASSIDKNVATIVGNESKALESKISEGELLEGKTDQSLSALNYIFSDASNASNSAKLNALYNLGYDTSALDAESITSDQLNGIWSKIYQNFLELGANREELNQNSTWMRQMQIATMSGQEMLDQKDIENTDKVMSDLIESNQGYNKTLSDMKKSLKDSNSQLADNDRLLKAHVIDYNNASKQLEELNQTLNDNYDIISDEANKGYPEYNAALEQIAISTNNAFGSDVNADFVAKHIEDFKKLAEGGEIAEEGFANLTRFINEEYINSLVNAGIITENVANDITSIINQLDGLEFGIDGTADFSAIFNALNDVIHNVEITKSVLQSLGYKVNFEFQTFYRASDGMLYATEMEARENSERKPVEVKVLKSVGTKLDTTSYKPLRQTSGSSSGKGSEKEYSAENPYDKLYNLNEKINEEISKRNRLEKQYQRLIAQHKETAEAVAKAYRDQVDSLRRSKALDETFVTERTAQLRQFVADNSKFRKYGTFVNDKVQIDYDSIDDLAKAVDTEEEEKFFDELIDYISKLEQWDDELDAKAESIIEYDIQIAQLYEEQRDAYLSFEDRVINAIVQVRQNQIDAKRDISESIKKADDDLMSAVRSNIDKIRQDRENENSEEEIAKKERRLAYLRQDTTGANQNEILSLEKELEDLKINYSDSLVDQSLDALQEQQDAAAEQREREIAIMESQLQWDQENGVIAQQAYQMITDTINGNIEAISALQLILEEGEGRGSLSVIAYDKWLDDFTEGLSTAGAFLLNEETDNYSRNADLDSKTNSDLGKAAIGSNPNSMEKPGENGATVSYDSAGASSTKNNPYGKLSDYTSDMGYTKGGKLYTGDKVKALQWALNDLGYSTGSKGIDGSFGPDTAAALKKFQQDAKAEGFNLGKYGANGWYGPYTAAIFKAKGYATGGLADYTGPAWLDGTPSKPEIVLNARDSENLIQLRNLLRDGSLGGGSTGDNYFSFDINIDELGSDYDVDKMADRIKELIYRDAMYRNVNAVGLQR